MSQPRRPFDEWIAALPDLRRKGRERVGPCPLRGGNEIT